MKNLIVLEALTLQKSGLGSNLNTKFASINSSMK